MDELVTAKFLPEIPDRASKTDHQNTPGRIRDAKLIYLTSEARGASLLEIRLDFAVTPAFQGTGVFRRTYQSQTQKWTESEHSLVPSAPRVPTKKD